jgi:hypothetical protein
MISPAREPPFSSLVFPRRIPASSANAALVALFVPAWGSQGRQPIKEPGRSFFTSSGNKKLGPEIVEIDGGTNLESGFFWKTRTGGNFLLCAIFFGRMKLQNSGEISEPEVSISRSTKVS